MVCTNAVRKITSDPYLAIIKVLGQKVAQQYWICKQQLDACSFHLVHGDSLGKNKNSFPSTFEFASGHLTVVATIFHWKQWDLVLCPLCWHAEETTNHVLLCPHLSTAEIWSCNSFNYNNGWYRHGSDSSTLFTLNPWTPRPPNHLLFCILPLLYDSLRPGLYWPFWLDGWPIVN